MNKRTAIAVNTRFLIKGKLEGIGLFTQEVMKAFVQQHPEIDFYFLFDRSYDSSFIFGPNVHPVVLFPPARHPFLWFIWFEWSVANWLNKHQPSLFISTDGFCSLRAKTPTITVIHDIAYEHFPNHVGKLVRRYYQYFVPKFIHHSQRIVTVSEFTKSDVIAHYQTPASKIDVVYNAAKEVYQPITKEEQEQVRMNVSNGKPYFVYVGSIHPRKNIVQLLEAFELFKTQTKSAVKLIIVGRKAWQHDDVEATLDQLLSKNDIQFLGHLSSEETASIVASSLAMCYVSLFEGFGIPIVEAQQAGTAVITSNLSSMPEAAGAGALLVDPKDTQSIADAMQRIFDDTALRETLIQRGFENCKRFSWEQSARKLWEICIKS
jgi:glycosyltransferase involved in cell wall biosynthesis